MLYEVSSVFIHGSPVKMSTAPSMQSKQASSRTLPLQAKLGMHAKLSVHHRWVPEVTSMQRLTCKRMQDGNPVVLASHQATLNNTNQQAS
jgi:hypothetical protein